MVKLIFVIVIFMLVIFVSGQGIQHEAVAINIEVPVRVFKGNVFIDNLTFDDFALYEDGILQKIDAVYLIQEKIVNKKEQRQAKKDEKKLIPSPQVTRNFVLMFEIIEYLPRVSEAIKYFFKNVILPGDSLVVVTPRKNYKFNAESFKKLPRDEIAKQLCNKLRKDAMLSSAEYRNLIRDFQTVRRTPWPPELSDLKVHMLLEIFRKLKALMYFNEKNAIGFADYLQTLEGQKHVFFFYQKNLIPVPPDLSDFDKFELFQDVSLNTDRIREAFSDSSVICHFLYIPDAPSDDQGFKQSEFRGKWMDSTAEIFRGFTEMSNATGGLTISSSNVLFSFRQAMKASENYYLLYYTPKNYKPDGKFKEIKVKVKGQKYKVLHRAGYLAD